MAELNLSDLVTKVKDTQLEATHRGRPVEENPFTDLVKQSYDTNTAKSIPVPNSGTMNKDGSLDLNAVKVINLVRDAARKQGIGVSVQTSPHKNSTEVRFLGKKLTKRTRQGKPDGSADATSQPTEAAAPAA